MVGTEEMTVSRLNCELCETCDVAETAEGKRPGIAGLCSPAVNGRSTSPLVGDLGDAGDVGVLDAMNSLKLSERNNGLGLDGRLPDLILFRMRWFITCPAPGATVTLVPEDTAGGGAGLEVRKRGCM